MFFQAEGARWHRIESRGSSAPSLIPVSAPTVALSGRVLWQPAQCCWSVPGKLHLRYLPSWEGAQQAAGETPGPPLVREAEKGLDTLIYVFEMGSAICLAIAQCCELAKLALR